MSKVKLDSVRVLKETTCTPKELVEACPTLGLNERTVRYWLGTGRLEGVRIGDRWITSLEAVQRMVVLAGSTLDAPVTFAVDVAGKAHLVENEIGEFIADAEPWSPPTSVVETDTPTAGGNDLDR